MFVPHNHCMNAVLSVRLCRGIGTDVNFRKSIDFFKIIAYTGFRRYFSYFDD